jgi:hypothetical protein
MQRYSSEDYAPPSSKNLKRRALIDKVLKLTCAVVGGRIVESGGEKGLVGVKADFSGRFVKL